MITKNFLCGQKHNSKKILSPHPKIKWKSVFPQFTVSFVFSVHLVYKKGAQRAEIPNKLAKINLKKEIASVLLNVCF